VVVDLACGTGILGFLACQAGAKRVYGIEQGLVIEAARDLAKQNGFADRATYVRGLSTRVELPELADVVVADQVGYFGVNSGLTEFLLDARRRFLRPGGKLVPQSVTPVLAPIRAEREWNQACGAVETSTGLDFGLLGEYGANSIHSEGFQTAEWLGEGIPLYTVDLASDARPPWRGSGIWTIGKKGPMHGFGGWFRCELAPGVEMTNDPHSGARIRRAMVFLPLPQPVELEVGDKVRANVTTWPDKAIYQWTGEVTRGGERVTHWSQSTWQGLQITREDLPSANRNSTAGLSERGSAKLLALQLCAKGASVSEITDRVCEAFPAAFPDRSKAAELVQTILTDEFSG